jgi:hypothetical protein
MGLLCESKYNCPDCDGDGRGPCPECGVEGECVFCDGTGWDEGQVDVAAFAEAVRALHKTMRDDGDRHLTHEGINRETKERWGRDGGKYGTVKVVDYLIDNPTRGLS